jgi:exopolysaccharide biosynthesis polyprenyl glycosylphosphotransferase
MQSSPSKPNSQGAAVSSAALAGLSSQQRRRRQKVSQILFILLLPCSDVALWISCYFGLSKITGSYNIITPASYLIPMGMLMGSLMMIGGYRPKTDFVSLRYASEHLIACLFALFASVIAVYFFVSFGPHATSSRAIFIASVFLFGPGSLLIRRWISFFNQGEPHTSKFLIIADERIGPVFHKAYAASGQRQSVRYVAAKKEMRGLPISGDGTPVPFVEAAHLLPHLNRESAADYEAVVVAADLSKMDPKILHRLGVINFEEIPVYTTETFYETYWKRFPIDLISHSWPLESEFNLVQHSVYGSIKRLLDVLTALVLLLIAAPFLTLVALAILIMDGQPVFYSQPRTGLHQKPFTLFKFRTMRVGSDKGDGYTREGDVRITALGSFLRKTRLDEFPQLWNVLRADMSMIGPRAEWTRLVEDYERQIANYHFRHLVRPGISGWAQVNYPYGANLEDTMQKLSYDLFYIRNFSLRLDAEVMLKTLHVMSFGKGR